MLFEYAGTLGLFDLDYTDPAGARDDFRGNWGTDDLDYLSRYDGLRAVRLNPLGAYVLGLTDRYEPPSGGHPAQQTLKVLPNLDIVVTGELPPADRLMLDAYAAQTADRVWTLGQATLLAALDAGRDLDHLRQFLTARATHDLPNPVTTLLADLAARAGRLRNLGMVRLIECADPALATLIAGCVAGANWSVTGASPSRSIGSPSSARRCGRWDTSSRPAPQPDQTRRVTACEPCTPSPRREQRCIRWPTSLRRSTRRRGLTPC